MLARTLRYFGMAWLGVNLGKGAGGFLVAHAWHFVAAAVLLFVVLYGGGPVERQEARLTLGTIESPMAKKVAVVEDEAELAALVEYNLERNGFAVRVLRGAKDTMRQLEDFVPDLILLDVMLPETDGFDLCRQIRKHATLARTPILFLTARSEEVDRVLGPGTGRRRLRDQAVQHPRTDRAGEGAFAARRIAGGRIEARVRVRLSWIVGRIAFS